MSLQPHERGALVFFLRHLLVGLGVGGLFGLLILASDLGGLRRMILASEDGWLFALLLFFGLFVTFGSLAMGAAVMHLGRDRD